MQGIAESFRARKEHKTVLFGGYSALLHGAVEWAAEP